MSARTMIGSVLDFGGGMAGAGMVLSAVLLLVEAAELPNKFELVPILLLLAGGIVLTVVRRLRGARMFFGAVLYATALISIAAALFLPVYV